MVAEQAGVPIVPAGIEGLERSPLSRLDRTQTNRTAFPRITLTVWPGRRPDVPPHLVGRPRREAYLRWLSDLMSEMAFRTTKVDLTLIQAIRAAGDSVGMGREAVADPIRGVLSYRKLLAGAAIYGRRFIAMGFQPRSRVGVLLPTAGGTLVCSTHAVERPPSTPPAAQPLLPTSSPRVPSSTAWGSMLSSKAWGGMGSRSTTWRTSSPPLGEKVTGLLRGGRALVASRRRRDHPDDLGLFGNT
jgi:hypothetical protein